MNLAMLEKALSLFLQGYDYDVIHAIICLWLMRQSRQHTVKRPLVATIHATEYGRNRGLHTDEQRYISDNGGGSLMKPGKSSAQSVYVS